jgi:hypothetical protein
LILSKERGLIVKEISRSEISFTIYRISQPEPPQAARLFPPDDFHQPLAITNWTDALQKTPLGGGEQGPVSWKVARRKTL